MCPLSPKLFLRIRRNRHSRDAAVVLDNAGTVAVPVTRALGSVRELTGFQSFDEIQQTGRFPRAVALRFRERYQNLRAPHLLDGV